MELARYPWQRIGARVVEGIDPPLLMIIMSLSMLGFAALFSATYESPGRVVNQVMHISLALCAMWVTAQIAPQTLMRFAVPAYIIGIAFLIAVALFGDVVNGARRWLHVGVTRFQPSEMMKIAVPMMLAWYFHRREATLRLRDFAMAAILLAVPFGLIVRQPDLGTASLVGAAGFYVIFFAGISWQRSSSWPCFRSGACCTTINADACSRCSTPRRTRSAPVTTSSNRPSRWAPAAFRARGG
jgi:rod shape determining protein RodA